MPIQPRPDWQRIAEAHDVEITGRQRERLESLSRAMLGLRGLIDWTEEPISVFACPEQAAPAAGTEQEKLP
jgi:hypothetical protein